MNVNDIALTLEKGLGVKAVLKLLEVFGTADVIYETSSSELIHAGLREFFAEQIVRKTMHRQAEKELKYAGKHGLAVLASTDDDYPPLMREMSDYPHVIYVKGDVNALKLRCVSMVGTRRITPYGQTMCDRLVRGLAERVPDLCVVSGLAFGIDVHCHRAALRYGAPTVAVIANTLPEVVPAQHTAIARDIIDHGGAIVTEYHTNSKQTGNFYLARNRLIAGLSGGTVVVEAPFDSGAMTTADLALGYNRIVMAVPGRTTDEMSFGTNLLIKSNKAHMVCSGEDIVRAHGWDLTVEEIGEKPVAAVVPISADGEGLLGCFPAGEAVSVDGLMEVTTLTYSVLAPILLELEFAGRIKRLPGGLYEKLN